MTKTYIKPETITIKVESQQIMQAASGGGVDNNGTPGNDYNSGDVSYSRGFGFFEEEDIEEEY